MNASINLKSYETELKKILVEEAFFNKETDHEDLEIRKFSYAINMLQFKSSKDASQKFIELLSKPLRKQSNYLLIEYLVALLKQNQVQRSLKVFKILLSKSSRSMVMDLIFQASDNKAKQICLTHLFQRCDPQAKFQFKFNDLIFFHRLCYENKLISKKVFVSKVRALLLTYCIQLDQKDFMQSFKSYAKRHPTPNQLIPNEGYIYWQVNEAFKNLTLLLMRSTLMFSDLGLYNQSEKIFLEIYNYFFKKYNVNILSCGCIPYMQNGNVYQPRYLSEMRSFKVKTKYLTKKDEILHRPYNLSLLNGGGLACPSPYKFSELLIKNKFSSKILKLLDRAYINCAMDKKNIYSFLPFIIELNNSYPQKKLTKKLNKHLFSLKLGRHKPTLLALPNKILKQYSVDPIKVRAHFFHSLEHGYNKTGLYYSDGSYWSEGFIYSEPPTINMQVLRFLYIYGDSLIKNHLEEMALETHYNRQYSSPYTYVSRPNVLIKTSKSINCISAFKGTHLILRELRVFLKESGDSFRRSVNKKLTLGPYWESHNMCRKPIHF